MSGLINFAVRGAQIVFAAIVTGLSINLAIGHHWGGLPITLGYVSFVGCASLLGAFVGLAATWVELFQGPIGLLVDGFICVINLAGGVTVAVQTRGINCASKDEENLLKIVLNKLMNGGCKKGGCYYWPQDRQSTMLARCKENQADAAFMFLTLIVVLVGLVLGFLRTRKGY